MFVIGEFLYSQYRNEKETAEETEDLLFQRRIFVTGVFVRTNFDCTPFCEEIISSMYPLILRKYGVK